MPFVKGMPRPAGAGRRKGSPQKLPPKDKPDIGYKSQSTGPRISVGSTVMGRDVSARLRALGCDPIEGMAILAMDKGNSPELRGRMFSELAQYEYPKLKAIEHSGVISRDESTSGRESLRARIAGIAARARTGTDPQSVN
jgi:hypothetical protein